MATSLHSEMWERIAAQLPPDEPKLVPMIWFVPGNIVDEQDEIGFEIYVVFLWNFSYYTTAEYEIAHARARMLGWDYATDADRAAHAAKQSYYMTRAKKKLMAI